VSVCQCTVCVYQWICLWLSTGDEGYMEMSAQTRSSLPTASDQIAQHLTVVHSYLRDDDAVDSSLQKRAYSVGSKPPTGKPQSSGSYVDMSVGRAAGLQHSLKDDVEKSSSAPHLNDELCRPPSGVANAEVSDLFMELDFNRQSDAAAAKDFRTRASSSGTRDFSQRRLNHNAKDALSRITFFPRSGSGGGPSGSTVISQDAARRPRTSTICQESLRPRTSSFGTSDDSRPRSSSGGIARFRDVFGTDSVYGGVRHFAKQHLTSNKQPSVESSADSLVAGAEYLDMMCGPGSRSSAVQATTPQQSDPYMVMRPGSSSTKPSDNLERTKSGIPSDQSAVLKDSSPHSPGCQTESVVESASADNKSTSTDVAARPTPLPDSQEVNPPVPFEVGISFQSLHYTAAYPGTSAANSEASVTSAATVSVAVPSTSVVNALSSNTEVTYTSLDLHGAAASAVVATTAAVSQSRPSEPVYRGAAHAYAEIDFGQSAKK